MLDGERIFVDRGIQCDNCKRLDDSAVTCEAFPEGIPPEILGGFVDHTKEFIGDGGLRYKAIDKSVEFTFEEEEEE